MRAGDKEVPHEEGFAETKVLTRASMTRTPRPSTTRTGPARSQSTTAPQDDLGELVTDLARWVPSDHHQVSMPPARSDISTPPTLPGTVTKHGTEWVADKARSAFEG